jgi:hypothetical protein
MSSATFKDVAFLASCIASELAIVRQALDLAVGNDDITAVATANVMVCRAWLLADLIGQATGCAAVVGGAADWSLTEGQLQRLEALRAQVRCSEATK